MRDELQTIRALGAELVVVGNGQPEHAQDFQQQHGLTFPLLVDPELTAYAAAGLRRDLGSTFNLRTVGNAVRALRGGHRQKKVQGDPWQQGGAFIITPQGELLYRQVSRAAGDHADPRAIIAALQGQASSEAAAWPTHDLRAGARAHLELTPPTPTGSSRSGSSVEPRR